MTTPMDEFNKPLNSADTRAQEDVVILEEEFISSFQKKSMSSSDRREPQSLWLISYSDFMTILMIFFLCMYGYSVYVKAAARHFARHREENAMAALFQNLQSNLKQGVQIEKRGERMLLRFPDHIFFQTGSASINKEAFPLLDQLASSLKGMKGTVVVEGHTDNIPIKSGSFKSNWELSSSRAFSVIEALSNRGLPESSLVALGFGETRPAAQNSDASGRQKNRRIEIFLIQSDKTS